MKLADSVAAELAQRAWLGIDAPGDPAGTPGIRRALELGLPGDVTLEDVGEWAQPALVALVHARDAASFEARLVGAIAAALILGAKLHETGGT